MKVLLPFQALNQYAEEVPQTFRSSACGPATAAAILNYHEGATAGIGQLYRKLGTTRIGLSAFCLIRNLQKLVGPRYEIKRVHSIEQAKQELIKGHPLALKFDRYFSLHWRMETAFAYHWVPLVGFEETADDLILFVHDNGQKNRPSKLRAVSYRENRNVLSFVRITPVPNRKSNE